MKYLDPTEQAIGTLTYRISQLERRINETIEPEMKQTGKSLLALRQELAAGRILFKEEGRKDAAAVVAGMRSWRDIVVPPELMIGKTTKRRGLKRSGGRNRTASVVAKRWALWKAQRAAGYTFMEISQAWGCNHSSIVNAAKCGFQPGKYQRRRK